MCGQEINITLFPDSYSLISLPKHHSSFPTSVFQVSCLSPFWIITLPIVAGSFGKTDSDSSLWIWSQSDRGARGMWSSHCSGYTSPSHKSFLCLHTTANCSAQTERCYFSGHLKNSCYSRTGTCSGRPDIAVCPVSYPHQLQPGCGRGQHPNSCITKTASHQAIQTGNSFAVCFHSSTSYEGYKLEFHFVLTAKQNLGWKDCDWGAFLDVLPFLSHRDCRWD